MSRLVAAPRGLRRGRVAHGKDDVFALPLQTGRASLILQLLKAIFNIERLPLVALLVAVLVALGLAFAGAPAHTAKAGGGDAQRLVAILQYLGSDYPAAVASQDAGELTEQRSLSAEAVSTVARLADPRFTQRVASIDARVARGDDPAGVGADCASLVDAVVAAAGLLRAPAAPPPHAAGARR